MDPLKEPQVIFAQLKAENEPIVVQSLCTNCMKNGKTTMLLTNIPFFKQVILISFVCEECGSKNSEIQFGGKLGPDGVKIVFTATTTKDLNRDIIKSEFAKITIPELDFEIPANKKGEVTTIEGLFVRCIEDLQAEQPVRKHTQPEVYEKIEVFIGKLEQMMAGEKLPFTLIMDDPSGNSYIKNPLAPKLDPRLHYNHYNRTSAMLQSMGYSTSNTQLQQQQIQHQKQQKKDHPQNHPSQNAHKIDFTAPFSEQSFLKTQAASFSVPCHSCGLMGQTKMCETNIPYFSDLIIMSFHCEYCGTSSTETKTSGEVKEKGTRITLKNPTAQDLKRDLFKSQTCALNIPELELELDYGTLGGCLTTVEGLIEKVSSHLFENNPFAGDSDSAFYTRMQQLFDELKACREGTKPFTMILIDPLGHSFLQNPFYPDPDPTVLVEHFERTHDQNEFLGLLDMKVQNYN